MLGPDRFNFETPNVIDPGEKPPSRPERDEKNEASEGGGGGAASASSGSKPTLDLRNRATISIALDGGSDPEYGGSEASSERQSNASPSGNDGDDDSIEHDQLPTAEQARMFAATMLSESNRRMNPETQPLSSTSPFGFGGNYSKSRYGGYRAHNRMSRQRMCHRILFVLAIVGAIAAFAAAVISFKMHSKDTSYANQKVPSDLTKRMEATFDILQSISDPKMLLTPGTPQYKAADWIANKDGLELDIPKSLDKNPYNFIQRYVLAVLYYSWNGENWTNDLHFVTDEHECGWFRSVPDTSGEEFAVGVTCDGKDGMQIRNLLIPSNNLEGTIPEEIRHLSKLDFLSLKHNNLKGPIPIAMGELTKLGYLDLKYNKELNGRLPDFFDNLTHLKALGLSNNQFSGPLPKSFGSLTGLKSLALDDNMLSGNFEILGQLTHMEYLYVDNNAFEGDLDFLLRMDRLVEVDLSGNNIQASSFPSDIFALPALEVLDLSDNIIDAALPEDIPESSTLTFFSIRSNVVHGDIPSALFNLHKLTHLDLEANEFTGDIPDSIGDMTNLSYLFIGQNDLTPGPIPDEWNQLTGLRELSADNTNRNGKLHSWIEDLNHLRLLDLRSNELTGPLPENIGDLKHLTFLLLSDNLFTGEIPPSLGESTTIDVLALHKTGLIETDDLFCDGDNLDLSLLTVDCGNVECSCCESCCSGENCFEGVVWQNLEHQKTAWEQNFKRAEYSFNPSIVQNDPKIKHRSGKS